MLNKIVVAMAKGFNEFCVGVLILTMCGGALVLSSQWWASKYCIQSTTPTCKLAISIANYWWLGFVIGIVLLFVLVVVKGFYRLINQRE
jgi:TRAP-type C4-dicarboxylate transport system permease small subunit